MAGGDGDGGARGGGRACASGVRPRAPAAAAAVRGARGDLLPPRPGRLPALPPVRARRRPRPPRDGRAAAAAAAEVAARVEAELSFMGALPRDYFCPTCGAARAQHCTKVPFKSVLMHVCVLNASDGVVDGDNERAIPQRTRRNSAQSSTPCPPLPRRSRRSTRSSTASPRTRSTGPSCTRRPRRARPSESTVRLLRRSGYLGGHLELDDQLETPGERACFRSRFRRRCVTSTPAHCKGAEAQARAAVPHRHLRVHRVLARLLSDRLSAALQDATPARPRRTP